MKIIQGKQAYKNASNTTNANPQWKFDGIVLNNDKTFNDYGIEEDDNITSNERSQGGKINNLKFVISSNLEQDKMLEKG